MCSGPAAFTDEVTLQGLQMLAYGLDNLPIEQVYDLKLQHDSKGPAYIAPPEEIAAFLRKRFTGNVPVEPRGDHPAADGRRGSDRSAGEVRRTGPGPVRRGRRRLADPDPASHGRRSWAWSAQVIPDAFHSPAIEQPAATARLLVGFFHDR